jgi:hypothetical protein
MKKSERFFSNKSDTAQGKSSIHILEIFIVLSVKIQTMIMS